MDNDNETRYSITVRYQQGDVAGELFNSCIEVDASGDDLNFTDRNGKTHEFHGVSYHIAEE
jgi:hypothetical protein